MPVALLFTGITRHPKIRRAGEKAGWMFICCLEYAAEFGTDGHIPTHAISGFGLPGTPARIKALLYGDDRHGPLLHRVDDGYEINDYLEWNQRAAALAEQAKAKSEKRAAAGKKGAAARWGNGKLHGKTDGKPDSKPLANGTANGSQTDDSSSSPSSCSSSGLESPSSAVDRREPPTADLSDLQTQAVAGLAAELHQLRPGLPAASIEAQVGRILAAGHKSWARLTIAAIACYLDPETHHASRIRLDDGYWWRDNDQRTQAALTRWVAAGHTNPAKALA